MGGPIPIFFAALFVFWLTDFLTVSQRWRALTRYEVSKEVFFAAYKRSRIPRFLNAVALSLISAWALTAEPLNDDNRWLFPVLIIILIELALVTVVCVMFAVKRARTPAR